MDGPREDRTMGLAIRCNRELPACERCVAKNIECSYPDRQKRTKKTTSQPLHRFDRDISAILDRLQRVEQQASTASARTGSLNTPSTLQDPSEEPRFGDSAGSTESPKLWDRSIASISDVNGDITPFNAASVLNKAVRLIEERRQRRNGAASVILQAIHIPRDAAKAWIQEYYAQSWGLARCFSKLVDRRLIEMMPDLEGLDGVHVDANIRLIYYCILWHGRFYSPERTPPAERPDRRYLEEIFMCCARIIPIWQNEASGTVYDFIAAMFVMETAMSNLHFGLSWDMHRRACEYAQALGLHNVDSVDAHQSENESSLQQLQPQRQQTALDDLDRMALWDLIQIDLFYRLMQVKPASLPASLDKWKVNMPWLSVDHPPNDGQTVPVMAFLARSRFTIILAEYFQHSEDSNVADDGVFMATVEPLCIKAESVFSEWQVEAWLQSYEGDRYHSWILTDLAMAGYICILFMLRKPHAPFTAWGHVKDDTIIRTNSSMRAARGALRTTQHYLDMVGSSFDLETMSFFLGVYQVHVAYAHLATGLLEDTPRWVDEDDMQLLKDFSTCMDRVTAAEPDFLPLKHACSSVYAEVERRTSLTIR